MPHDSLIRIHSYWPLAEAEIARIGRRRIRAAWAANAIIMLLFTGMLSVLLIGIFGGLPRQPTILLDFRWDTLK